MDLTLSLLHLGLNCCLLYISTKALWSIFGLDRGAFEMDATRVFVLVCAQIVGASLILGYLGFLSAFSLTFFQFIEALTFASIAAKRCCFRLRFSLLVSLKDWSFIERLYLGVFAFLALLLLLHGFFIQPLDFDSLGYRLSRIGLWLQEGSIWQTETTDPRMNYTAPNADFLMLWLTAPFDVGYPLCKVVQWLSGIMLMLSTLGFARLIGISRLTGFALVAIMACMPVLIGQMTTVQIDLFFAAILTASLLLLYQSLQNRRSPWLAWLGLGVAVGTKGTIFYLAPGLLCLGLLWLYPHWKDTRLIGRQILAAVVCVCCFGFPRYVENYFAYGSPFAPQNEIQRLHGAGQSMDVVDKLVLNVGSYFIEQFIPRSNPPGVDLISGKIMEQLIPLFPDDDPYRFSLNRKKYYELRVDPEGERMLSEISLSESWGMIPGVLAFAGCLVFLFQLQGGSISAPTRMLLLGWLCLAFVFVVLLSGFFNWSAYKFRYFLCIVPVVVLLAGLLVEQIKSRAHHMLVALLVALSVLGYFKAYFQSHTTGFLAYFEDKKTSVFVAVDMHEGALREIEPESRIAVSVPYYAPLSTFFRTKRRIHTTLVSAENLSNYASAEDFLETGEFDYLITHSEHFDAYDGRSWVRIAEHILGHHAYFNIALHRLPREGESYAGVVHSIRTDSEPARGLYELDTFVTPYPDSVSAPVVLENMLDFDCIVWIQVAGELVLRKVNLERNSSLEIDHPLPQSKVRVRVLSLFPALRGNEFGRGFSPVRLTFTNFVDPL